VHRLGDDVDRLRNTKEAIMSKQTLGILIALLFLLTFLTPILPLGNGIAVYVYYLFMILASSYLTTRLMAQTDEDA
jgi:hypothetical protein